MKYKNYNRTYISIYIILFVFYIGLIEKSWCSETQEIKEVDTNVNQTLEIEDDNLTKENNRIITAESQTSNESGDKTDDSLININPDNLNIHMNDNYNQTSENNLDNEDESLFKDEGVLEETNEEILKEAESVDKKSKTEETEWEKEISDFEPAEILTLELNQQKEFLYDPITEIPSQIKLAFVVNDEQAKINFNILDPDQNIIYSALEKDHLFYNFIADKKGEYVFTLENSQNKNNLKVTFAIHQGNSTNSHLMHEHLQNVWDKINAINKSLKSSRFTAKLLSQKYDSHFEFAQKHNRDITLMSIIETAFLILIFFFQLCYIKRLANKIN